MDNFYSTFAILELYWLQIYKFLLLNGYVNHANGKLQGNKNGESLVCFAVNLGLQMPFIFLLRNVLLRKDGLISGLKVIQSWLT
jgi:hypothetical protein